MSIQEGLCPDDQRQLGDDFAEAFAQVRDVEALLLRCAKPSVTPARAAAEAIVAVGVGLVVCRFHAWRHRVDGAGFGIMTDMYVEDVRHLVPKDDLIGHEVDTEGRCICGPDAEIIQRDGESDLHRYRHHPLDTRLLADS